MVKSIRKNYVYNLLYQILTILIPVITTPYLARVLGVEGTGISSYTLSIVSYFIILGSVGVASYGQREIAMQRDSKKNISKIFWELFYYKTIISFITLLLYLIIIFYMNNYKIIMLILSLNIIASILDISWFYQGIEEYKFISIRNIFIKIIFTICIFIFIKNTNDLNLYIFLSSLSILLSSISLWFHIPKLLIKVSFKELKIFSHWKNTLIYFLPQIATSIYTLLDKTMLGYITGLEVENGYYEQAHKIINITLTVITSLNTVMSPRMSYLYKEKKLEEIKIRLLQSLKFVLFLSLPMSLGLIAISSSFVPWFFGIEYEQVSILLPIFAPIIFVIAISNCLGSQCLTPCGKRGKSSIALWIGAIVNVIINLLLIPTLKSIGAVIASIGAETVITIIYFYLSKEYISIKRIFLNTWKYAFSSFIMFFVVFFLVRILPIRVIYTVIEVITGILLYLFVLFILKDDLICQFGKEFINYGKKIHIKRRNNM